MEDDDETPGTSRSSRPSPAKMSKTSSWVTLGFFLGAATVWAYLTHQEKIAPAAPVALKEWPTAAKLQPSPLTTIEALFEAYGTAAVWENNVTQVAMWRPDTKEYSEFYEVRRVGEELYFRSIPRLTHMLIQHGKLPSNEVPLKFTETEAQYKEWLESTRFEKSDEPSLQPSLLGPAVIEPGEKMPRPTAPKPKSRPPAMPVPEIVDKDGNKIPVNPN